MSQCPCGREIIKDQFCAETPDQFAKRYNSGRCRAKCARLYPPSPPSRVSSLEGGWFNHKRPELRAVVKEVPERDAARLAYARSLPCCACRSIVGVHAHHVLTGGTGTKCADRFSVSLCYVCHFEVHQIGKLSFENKHGIDLLSIAMEIDKAYNSRK